MEQLFCFGDGICPPSHQSDECGTRPFLRWVRAQGRSPHAPGISKNASDPVGNTLKGALKAPGDKPNPSEEGSSLRRRPPEAGGISSDKTHPTWTAHRIMAGRMCPINWIFRFSKGREAILFWWLLYESDIFFKFAFLKFWNKRWSMNESR